MKIYDLVHFWDNGESYEDYRSYQDHFLYSSLELASAKYEELLNDSKREGKWVVEERELDTGTCESKRLLESDYKGCSSVWDNISLYETDDDEEELMDDYQDDPCDYYEADEKELQQTEEELNRITDSILKANYTYHPNVDLHQIVKDVLEIGNRYMIDDLRSYYELRHMDHYEGTFVNGLAYLDRPDVVVTFSHLMFRIQSFGDGILMQFYPANKDGDSSFTDGAYGISYDPRV